MAIANQSYLLLAAADRECDQARSNLDILGDSDSGIRQRKGQLSIDTSRLTSKRKRRTKATSTQSQQQQQEQPPTSYDKKAKSVQKSFDALTLFLPVRLLQILLFQYFLVTGRTLCRWALDLRLVQCVQTNLKICITVNR